MKNVTWSFCVLSVMLAVSCNDSNSKSSDGVTKSDTVISGLEGSRDQSGQLSTDVKPDTTSGQTEKVRSLGQQADSINDSKNGTSTDEQFVHEAVAGNTEEVALAKMAVQRSSNNEIKKIAGELEKDHTAALQELKDLSDRNNYGFDKTRNDLDNNMTGMRSKKGADFDKAWCEFLIEKHKTTISKYEQTASGSASSDLKQWITKTLPKLRMHNDHLMVLHGKL